MQSSGAALRQLKAAASEKLRGWYGRLCEHKKPRLVRTGPLLRVFSEMYRMLKKGNAVMEGRRANIEKKMGCYRNFLKKRGIVLETA